MRMKKKCPTGGKKINAISRGNFFLIFRKNKSPVKAMKKIPPSLGDDEKNSTQQNFYP